jgi:hypothetical protein
VNNQELLIDHLDKTLQGESIPEAAALIASDSQAREEWEYLQTAVEAVQHVVLYDRVGAIRAEMQGARVVPMPPPTVRRKAGRWLRIAASLVLLVGAFTIYKFATVSTGRFYNEHFSTYSLSTTRGEAEASALEEAYRNNNWDEVVSQYNALTTKTNKEHFLAGMAAMELSQFPQAIERFNTVLTSNAATGDNYFQDEAEYYLALAYIASKQPGEADVLLKRISASNNHVYQQKARNMLGLDWKIIRLRN